MFTAISTKMSTMSFLNVESCLHFVFRDILVENFATVENLKGMRNVSGWRKNVLLLMGIMKFSFGNLKERTDFV